jgi:hypothetical protein
MRCHTAPRDSVFWPCNHVMFCDGCAEIKLAEARKVQRWRFMQCPDCGQNVHDRAVVKPV